MIFSQLIEIVAALSALDLHMFIVWRQTFLTSLCLALLPERAHANVHH